MEIIGKEQRLTWNLPGAHQAHLGLTCAGPAHLAWCQSSPTSASRQRRDNARRARRRHATRLPACVAWPPRRRASSPRRRPDPLDHLALSLSLVSLLCFLSLTRPNAAVAADELPRGHSHRLASPTPPKPPPRPTLPPHRSKQHQEPCSDAIAAIFTDGHRRSPARFAVSVASSSTLSCSTTSP